MKNEFFEQSDKHFLFYLRWLLRAAEVKIRIECLFFFRKKQTRRNNKVIKNFKSPVSSSDFVMNIKSQNHRHFLPFWSTQHEQIFMMIRQQDIFTLWLSLNYHRMTLAFISAQPKENFGAGFAENRVCRPVSNVFSRPTRPLFNLFLSVCCTVQIISSQHESNLNSCSKRREQRPLYHIHLSKVAYSVAQLADVLVQCYPKKLEPQVSWRKFVTNQLDNAVRIWDESLESSSHNFLSQLRHKNRCIRNFFVFFPCSLVTNL